MSAYWKIAPELFERVMLLNRRNAKTAQLPHKGRMIILCFDGTTNSFDGDNTNVVKLIKLLDTGDEEQQLVYYQPGVGTYVHPSFITPISSWVAKVADGAFAWYLNAHVQGGYQYLMQNWREGDKISIFGFSRGAYIARALAGMLTKVGLLQRDNTEQVPFAYKMYSRTDKNVRREAEQFKKTFCREVEVDFLGVWDTVASTGVLSHALPFTTKNASIKFFRHALSLDERRTKFSPTFYTGVVPDKNSHEEDAGKGCNAKEVWFAGSHSDVGGGLEKDDKDFGSLAHIPLRWMVAEIIRSKIDIKFDWAELESLGLPKPNDEFWNDPDKLEGRLTMLERDGKDATKKSYDSLKSTPLWWFLEVVPLPFPRTNSSGYIKTIKWNFGRGRKVPSKPETLLFHDSVKRRMEVLGYKPKIRYWKGTEVKYTL